MENSLYEEYMRSVLGYNNTYDYEYSRIENTQHNAFLKKDDKLESRNF